MRRVDRSSGALIWRRVQGGELLAGPEPRVARYGRPTASAWRCSRGRRSAKIVCEIDRRECSRRAGRARAIPSAHRLVSRWPLYRLSNQRLAWSAWRRRLCGGSCARTSPRPAGQVLRTRTRRQVFAGWQLAGVSFRPERTNRSLRAGVSSDTGSGITGNSPTDLNEGRYDFALAT